MSSGASIRSKGNRRDVFERSERRPTAASDRSPPATRRPSRVRLGTALEHRRRTTSTADHRPDARARKTDNGARGMRACACVRARGRVCAPRVRVRNVEQYIAVPRTCLGVCAGYAFETERCDKKISSGRQRRGNDHGRPAVRSPVGNYCTRYIVAR